MYGVSSNNALFAVVEHIIEYGRDADAIGYEHKAVKTEELAVNPLCVAAVRRTSLRDDWSEILLAGDPKWYLINGRPSEHTNFFCEVAKMAPGGFPKR